MGVVGVISLNFSTFWKMHTSHQAVFWILLVYQIQLVSATTNFDRKGKLRQDKALPNKEKAPAPSRSRSKLTFNELITLNSLDARRIRNKGMRPNTIDIKTPLNALDFSTPLLTNIPLNPQRIAANRANKIPFKLHSSHQFFSLLSDGPIYIISMKNRPTIRTTGKSINYLKFERMHTHSDI